MNAIMRNEPRDGSAHDTLPAQEDLPPWRDS